MTLFKSFDAAFPLAGPVRTCAAGLGYIGRGGFTPHVWTRDEWNRAIFNHGLYGMPIWVPDFSITGFDEGVAAAAAARGLGWFPGRAIVLDMETGQGPTTNPLFAAGFIRGAASEGYREITYESQSIHGVNPAGVGYWIARWDGDPVVSGGNILGHQYTDTGQIDLSVWEASALQYFGKGPRK